MRCHGTTRSMRPQIASIGRDHTCAAVRSRDNAAPSALAFRRPQPCPQRQARALAPPRPIRHPRPPRSTQAQRRGVEMVGAGLTRGVLLRPWTRRTPISIAVFGGNSGFRRTNSQKSAYTEASGASGDHGLAAPQCFTRRGAFVLIRLL